MKYFELSDKFKQTGTDRIILRNQNKEKRLKEISEGMKLRRQSGVTPQKISRARGLFKKYISSLPSPLIHSQKLDDFVKSLLPGKYRNELKIFLLDATVMRKNENRSGSFKDYVPIALYDEIEKGNIPRLVHTVSTGNHAFAVTNAAAVVNKKLGLKVQAVATMDKGAAEHKKQNIRDFGGMVREEYKSKPIMSYKEAEDIVNEETANDQTTLRIPHDDKQTACGYAILAREAEEQLIKAGINPADYNENELVILSPLGSGGLQRGLLELMIYPNIKVYGVSAPPAIMTYESIRLNEAQRWDMPSDPDFRSDGIMATTEASALLAIKQLAEGALLVRDEDASIATALLFWIGCETEPTSGLPLAALILHHDLFKNTKTVVIPLTSRHIEKQIAEQLRLQSTNLYGIQAYFKRRLEEINN